MSKSLPIHLIKKWSFNEFWLNINGIYILTIHRILRVCTKSLKGTISLSDLSKAFNSIHRGNIQLILLVSDLPKETVTAIMMLCKNKKDMVSSPNDNIDFFDNVTGGIFAPSQFIICQYYRWQISIFPIKENGFTLKKTRSRWYPTKTITDSDETSDEEHLANTPVPVECQMDNLGMATKGIGFNE